MIYTLTFNPSLDYVVEVSDFKIGSVNRTHEEMMYPGGKGINVSQVLSTLGVDNVALGFVAGFTGDKLVEFLQDMGVNSDFIKVKNGMTRINVKLHHSFQETEINGQGPHVLEQDVRRLFEKIRSLRKGDILVISGSVPKGVATSIYADILKVCNEKDIKAIVDASGALLWNVLDYRPFLIKPNQHELGEIYNRKLTEHEEIVFYAKDLQNRGAKNVLVSLGANGALLVAEDGQIYFCDAPEGEVINTVGAGDSMVAGFLMEYQRSKDYEKSLRYAVCTGSASAFSKGLATKEQIDAIFIDKSIRNE